MACTMAVLWVCCLVVVGTVAVGQSSTNNRPPCNFPAIYNFGDSNSDTGGISAAFQPNPWPYGETFFNKPVGRSCDGRLLIDFIAESLGLPYLSAYLNSIGSNYSHGANFATGGSTIRRQNETIFQYGISPFSLDVQIWHDDQFKSRASDLYNQTKNPFEKSVLPNPQDFSKALYTFDIGQNDLSVAFRTLSDDQLRAAIPDIIGQFSSAVRHLYEQGARSFWIHNTGPIGCLPVATFYIMNPKPGFLDQYGCIKGQNDMAVEFNNQLKDAVTKLKAELSEAAITYVDLYAAKYGLISTAKSQACCMVTWFKLKFHTRLLKMAVIGRSLLLLTHPDNLAARVGNDLDHFDFTIFWVLDILHSRSNSGFADPLKTCCGYHEKDGNVWCGQKGVTYNGTTVFGASCSKPDQYISWDGVHYSEAANHWFANHILNGSLSDPPTPITQACYRN